MRVILKRSLMVLGKKKPVGTIIGFTKEKAEGLISSGFAEGYTGEIPPRGKLKMDLKHLKSL